RIARAKHAIETRWAKNYDWEFGDLDTALEYLAELRVEVEKGGTVLQNRISTLKVTKVKCYGCENMIDLTVSKGFVGMRTRNNFDTGVPESAYACSQKCWMKVQAFFEHPRLQRTQA